MTHEANHTVTEEAVEDVAEFATDAAAQVFTWWEWATKTLAYIQSTFVSIVFFFLFAALIIWLWRLNVGNSEYENFRIADMVRRKDGSIDRKAMERAMLFLATLYGFLYVVHKHSDLIVGYLWAMATVWLGYQVADNKLANKGKPPELPSPEQVASTEGTQPSAPTGAPAS